MRGVYSFLKIAFLLMCFNFVSAQDSNEEEIPEPFEGIEPIEVARMKFEAFNEGFQGDSLAQNFSSCNAKMLIWQYYELPTMQVKVKYSSGNQAAHNITIFAQNTSYPLNYCTDALQQIYFFIDTQAEYYGSTGGYLRAAMLNMFANAIRVQQITKKLQTLEDTTTQDVLSKLYYTGLLLNIIVVFEPPTDAGDLDIDLGEEDLFSLNRKFELKQLPDLDFDNDVIDDFGGGDDTDVEDDAPNGAIVITNPINLVQFMTGFAIGTNLTDNSEQLNICQSTLSNNIIVNSVIFGSNVLSLSPEMWFTAAYAMWDIFYFSEPLVEYCSLLGYAMQFSFDSAKEDIFKLSRLLNNVSNNYDNAYTSYSDVKMFMQTKQPVENRYAMDSYQAGYSTGRMFYYILFTTQYENLNGDPVDPFYSLNNQEEDGSETDGSGDFDFSS